MPGKSTRKNIGKIQKAREEYLSARNCPPKQNQSKPHQSLEVQNNNSGYRQFREPCTGQLVFTHKRVAEKKLGRAIAPGEVVHHINKNKQDNRPQNLSVMPAELHRYIHQSEYREKNACFKCGYTSHFAVDCFAKKTAYAKESDHYTEEDSYDEVDSGYDS